VTGTRRAARLAAWPLLAVGILLLAHVAYVVVDADLYQARERARFEQVRAPAPAALTAPIPPVPPPRPAPVEGEAIGDIEIPRLGMDVVVAQGDSAAVLGKAVGHLDGTALPGQAGNVVLAGHRDTFFRSLQGVRVGDGITLRTDAGSFGYVVESTEVVPPTDVQVIQPTGGRTLTLVTCYPFWYIGPAPNRFIVRARQVAGR
jgi:sortase A